MTATILGVVLGGLFALGLWSLIAGAGSGRRVALLDRVQPHVLDFSEGARQRRDRQNVDPLPVLGTFVTAILYRLSAAVPFRGREDLGLTLRRVGADPDPARLRASALAFGMVGGAAGLALGALALTRGMPAWAVAIAALAGAVAGRAIRIRAVRARADTRVRMIVDELPGVIEITLLSIAAGEGILEALRRAGTLTGGPLGREIEAALAAEEAGETASASLESSAHELRIPELHRFIDHLVAAMERGAPVVDVLRSQLGELRDARRRRLIESAGRREIAMLLPLVFVILPVTVLFAVFPGVAVLGSVV